jgi:lipopolysaccharide transport system permease protein
MSYLEITIEPSSGWGGLKWRDLWMYRELLYFLCWRDIKVRYKQTVLGAAWAIIQPFLTMLVFSVIFGRLAKVPSDGIPYPIFTYVALLPWTLFVYGLNQASNSLVNSANLITKVYFPRLVLPMSSILSGLLDFIIAFVVLIGMMLFYEIRPTMTIILLPLFILLTLAATLGVGLWLAALNVQYRDIRYAVPFLTQFWFFITPVAYSSSLIAEPWRTLYGLNPMVGVVEGFRWILLGKVPSGPMLSLSVITTLCLLVSGLYYFRRMEKSFADVV